MNRLLTKEEVAEILRVSENVALILMGRMPHIDVSTSSKRRNLRVWESDFQAWCDKQRAADPERPKGRRAKKTPVVEEIHFVPYRHTERVNRNAQRD